MESSIIWLTIVLAAGGFAISYSIDKFRIQFKSSNSKLEGLLGEIRDKLGK
jgi:hypothetical protein